jgi:hypothetical protein
MVAPFSGDHICEVDDAPDRMLVLTESVTGWPLPVTWTTFSTWVAVLSEGIWALKVMIAIAPKPMEPFQVTVPPGITGAAWPEECEAARHVGDFGGERVRHLEGDLSSGFLDLDGVGQCLARRRYGLVHRLGY